MSHDLYILQVDAGERVVLQGTAVEFDHCTGQVYAGEVAAGEAHHSDLLHAFGQSEAREVGAVEEHMTTQFFHALGQGDAAHLAIAETAVADLAVRVGDVHPGK